MAIKLVTNTNGTYLNYLDGSIAVLRKNLSNMISQAQYRDMPLQTYDTRGKVNRDVTNEEREKILAKLNADHRNLLMCKD